jgi:hypothetical protein
MVAEVGLVDIDENGVLRFLTMRHPTARRVVDAASNIVRVGGRIDIYRGNAVLTIHKQAKDEFWIQSCLYKSDHRDQVLVTVGRLKRIVTRFLAGYNVTLVRMKNVLLKQSMRMPGCCREPFEMRASYGFGLRPRLGEPSR